MANHRRSRRAALIALALLVGLVTLGYGRVGVSGLGELAASVYDLGVTAANRAVVAVSLADDAPPEPVERPAPVAPAPEPVVTPEPRPTSAPAGGEVTAVRRAEDARMQVAGNTEAQPEPVAPPPPPPPAPRTPPRLAPVVSIDPVAKPEPAPEPETPPADEPSQDEPKEPGPPDHAPGQAKAEQPNPGPPSQPPGQAKKAPEPAWEDDVVFTPPGQGGTPPGKDEGSKDSGSSGSTNGTQEVVFLPPGQGGKSPGQEKKDDGSSGDGPAPGGGGADAGSDEGLPPGQGGTPPGHGGTPPGQVGKDDE